MWAVNSTYSFLRTASPPSRIPTTLGADVRCSSCWCTASCILTSASGWAASGRSPQTRSESAGAPTRVNSARAVAARTANTAGIADPPSSLGLRTRTLAACPGSFAQIESGKSATSSSASGRSGRTFTAIAFTLGPYARNTTLPVTAAESSAAAPCGDPVITTPAPALSPPGGCPSTRSTSWPVRQVAGTGPAIRMLALSGSKRWTSSG